MSDYIGVDSYKKNPTLATNQKYDAIVIGSGIGGLGTAAFMAREGKKILVLEQHYTPGGYTHVFKRRDYEWDVGIHYIGEVHREHTTLSRLFRYISDGQLEWAELGDVYDRIFFGEEEYEFWTGADNFKARMKGYFPEPEDQIAIDKYVDLIYAAQKASFTFFAEKAVPPLVAKMVGGKMRKGMMQFSNRTTMEVLKDITQNEKLIAVLVGQFGDYGLPPKQSSFVIHAMVAKHYMNGASFPVGGCMRIVETVCPVIASAGGLVLTNARVKQIMVRNKKAIGVRMEDGQEVFAPMVISSAGVINTYEHMLHPEVSNKLGLLKQLKKVAPSVAHICLYIGFKHTVEELGLQKANYWIYPKNGYDHDKNFADYLADPENTEFPVVYISFPAAKDPDWENRYPGRSTIDIITLASYDWYKEWEDNRWKKRGEEYDAFKEKMAQRLLNKMYEYLPQLKGKVDYYELSTPLSTKHFCNYQKGELYGLNHTPERFQQDFLRVHTPIKNLYLTGQDVVSAGIGGALAGGMITASAILKKNISDRVKKWDEQRKKNS